MPAKILVTGFRAFLGESLNPSEMLLSELAQQPGVETLLLPVEYAGAFQVLAPRLRASDYDLILLLGQATGSKRIRLERVAFNLMDSQSPDESGAVQLESPVDPQGPTALTTSLRLRDLWAKLDRPEAIEISNSAGAYVCNSTYYQCLQELRKLNRKAACLFVHVPPLPEQKAAQNGASMPYAQMKDHVLAILRELRAELSS